MRKESRNATNEKVLRKESVEIKSQRIRNSTDEKALWKECVQVVKRLRIRNTIDENTS